MYVRAGLCATGEPLVPPPSPRRLARAPVNLPGTTSTSPSFLSRSPSLYPHFIFTFFCQERNPSVSFLRLLCSKALLLAAALRCCSDASPPRPPSGCSSFISGLFFLSPSLSLARPSGADSRSFPKVNGRSLLLRAQYSRANPISRAPQCFLSLSFSFCLYLPGAIARLFFLAAALDKAKLKLVQLDRFAVVWIFVLVSLINYAIALRIFPGGIIMLRQIGSICC